MLWAGETAQPGGQGAVEREWRLPTGEMHLVVRLGETPLRLYDYPGDPVGRTVGRLIVAGTRATPYLADISRPVRSLGVQLRPGAAELLLGATAEELAGRHTALDDLWGGAAADLRDRLLEARHPDAQLDLLEAMLAARLPAADGLHPAVRHALARLGATDDVGAVVRETGYSHRHLVAMFRRQVGLTPKLYCRVLRFQRALDHLVATPEMSLVELALEAGYSDQAHLNRDFTALAGVSPGRYRRLAPVHRGHVPVVSRPPGRPATQVKFVQERAARSWQTQPHQRAQGDDDANS
jgi:AraC-like DNA-binding protein